MALTRKLLRGMNLTDEQVETIIEAHTETVDGLKEQMAGYKDDAEKLPAIQHELDTLKQTVGDGGDVVTRAEYDRLKTDYNDYKNGVIAKETKTAKVAAFRSLLNEAGIDPRRIDAIVKITDTDSIELAEDGKIKDATAMTETVKRDYSDFVVTVAEKGADVATPPGSTGGGAKLSRDQIMAIKDGTQRRRAIAENLELFESTAN